MNVIQAADFLSITASKMESLSDNDAATLSEQLKALKNQNVAITDKVIVEFSEAMQQHRIAFREILSQRVLFNFFAQKDLARSQFPNPLSFQDNRKTRLFVELFLAEEMQQLIPQKMTENDLEGIRALAEIQGFLPQSVSELIVQHLHQKLDAANQALIPNYSDFSKIVYIKDHNFFELLSQFRTIQIEEKVKTLFNAVKNLYYKNNNSELSKLTFAAMKHYKAIDPVFTDKIAEFKNESEMRYQPFTVNRRKHKWVYFLIGIVVCLQLNFLIGRLSEINFKTDTETYDAYTDAPELDPYYTNMKFKIDSFQVFLLDYNPKEIRRLSLITSVKTGQNPFETFYEYPPTGESSNNLRVANESAYDMILLENAILYDSIKIPRAAHFIKAGDYNYIHFSRDDVRSVFNVYVGKKLATFQTESNHLFVRDGSIVEYRFSELAPNAKAVLAEDYEFKNDVKINYSNGKLVLE